jgi:dipeptidyl aminopeptidase/acylaminoacyl peptidase
LLIDASLLFAADKIRIPILNGQGATYARVQQPESEQIAAAIEKNSGDATYVLYPDEGHDSKK